MAGSQQSKSRDRGIDDHGAHPQRTAADSDRKLVLDPRRRQGTDIGVHGDRVSSMAPKPPGIPIPAVETPWRAYTIASNGVNGVSWKSV